MCVNLTPFPYRPTVRRQHPYGLGHDSWYLHSGALHQGGLGPGGVLVPPLRPFWGCRAFLLKGTGARRCGGGCSGVPFQMKRIKPGRPGGRLHSFKREEEEKEKEFIQNHTHARGAIPKKEAFIALIGGGGGIHLLYKRARRLLRGGSDSLSREIGWRVNGGPHSRSRACALSHTHARAHTHTHTHTHEHYSRSLPVLRSLALALTHAYTHTHELYTNITPAALQSCQLVSSKGSLERFCRQN